MPKQNRESMITPKEVADLAYKLCLHIEKCGASENLTTASVLAAEVHTMIKSMDQALVGGENLETDEHGTQFREWAVVELMGHLTVVGLCTEATVAGQKLLRVDALNAKGDTHTRYFGPGSIYAITPCSEQIARGMATNIGQDPISRFDLAALARGPVQPSLPYDEQDDENGGQ